MKLPQVVYVKSERDVNDKSEYLVVESDVAAMSHGDVVGTYRLVDQGRIDVSVSLKSKRKSK